MSALSTIGLVLCISACLFLGAWSLCRVLQLCADVFRWC